MKPVPPVLFPSVPLPALGGGQRDLARVERRTLVAVGHGDCPTTRLLLRYAERLHRERRGEGEVAVVLQDTPDDARAVVEELGITAPVLLDGEPWPLGRALGLETVPVTLLVAPGGRIERTWSAFRRADLEEAAALLDVPLPFFAPDDPAPALRPG